MRLTFVIGEWSGKHSKTEYTMHKVSVIGLSAGAHDIPEGFVYTATCGKRYSTTTIDLDNQEEEYVGHIKCEQCFVGEIEVAEKFETLIKND